MFVSFPTSKGNVAVNTDHIQRIQSVEGHPNLTSILFSVLADGSTEFLNVRAPLHVVLAWINSALAL